MSVISVPAVSNKFSTAWAVFYSRVKHIRVPDSIRMMLETPLTILGITLITAGILTVSVIAGLIVLGTALIALEFLYAFLAAKE